MHKLLRNDSKVDLQLGDGQKACMIAGFSSFGFMSLSGIRSPSSFVHFSELILNSLLLCASDTCVIF